MSTPCELIRTTSCKPYITLPHNCIASRSVDCLCMMSNDCVYEITLKSYSGISLISNCRCCNCGIQNFYICYICTTCDHIMYNNSNCITDCPIQDKLTGTKRNDRRPCGCGV